MVNNGSFNSEHRSINSVGYFTQKSCKYTFKLIRTIPFVLDRTNVPLTTKIKIHLLAKRVTMHRTPQSRCSEEKKPCYKSGIDREAPCHGP